MTKPQTFEEGRDRILRYQFYKAIGLFILVGLMYLATNNEEEHLPYKFSLFARKGVGYLKYKARAVRHA